MKSILLVCNDSNTVINFRKDLILFLASKGFKIDLVIGDNKRIVDIKKLPLNPHVLSFKNKSLNVFRTIHFEKKLRALIKKINPDVVFNFQIKPNIFGTRCAHKCGIKNIYCMVEGLGNPFMPKNFIQKIIRSIVIRLYRKTAKLSTKFFFINKNDKKQFIEYKIIDDSKCVLINGIGIDTNSIKKRESLPQRKKIVYMARLIRNKGIVDYCDIASLVRKTRTDIEFDLYGEPGDIPFSTLSKYFDSGTVNYMGYTNKPIEDIEEYRIMCSTSYREGIPKIILEAMALGIPVVASDVIGNNDIVINEITGYLISISDKEMFAKRIIELVDNDDLLITFGKNARKICEDKYDSFEINNQIYSIISTNLF